MNKSRGEAGELLQPGDDSDQRLVRASREGNLAAFAKLYEKHRSSVYAVCLAILKDPALAEDAVHDTFLRAILNLSRFERGKPLQPWLGSIARRRCIDILRYGERGHSLERMAQRDLAFESRDPFTDPTLEQVIGAERIQKLHRALATLSPRQRRALLLFADGWTYADIASAEGSSVGAVNLVLVRARKKLRAVWEKLGAAVPSWQALRERLQAAAGLVQRNPQCAEPGGWLALCGQVLLAGGLALTLTAQMQGPVPLQIKRPISSRAPAHAESRQISTASGAIGFSKLKSNSKNKTPTPAQLLDLNGISAGQQEENTPENTRFTSIKPSPNYEQDHTVFATGWPPGGCLTYGLCHSLFVSHDGGATWERLPGRGLKGIKLLLPSNYPADDRIFAINEMSGPVIDATDGIQESLDGGETFTTVSNVAGLAAISPGWSSGDRRILISQEQTLYEYLADEHRTNLIKFGPITGNQNTRWALSPRFPADPTYLLGFTAQPSWPVYTTPSTLYVCSTAGCAPSTFTDPIQKIMFSPDFEQDEAVYVLGLMNKTFRSTDMMKTYQQVDIPQLDLSHGGVYWNLDMELSSRSGSKLKLSLATLYSSPVSGYPISVYSLENGMASTSRIELPRFDYFKLLTTASTGRLFAAGSFGMACLEDGGNSWQARCSAEPGS